MFLLIFFLLKKVEGRVCVLMVFDINDYFQDFLRAPSIFLNHDTLRPEYIPDRLLHRDLQIRRVAEIVACSMKKSTPSNIFLFGKTGTGKTAVVRFVRHNLNAQCRKNGLPEPIWIYLNCQQVNTGYRILANICKELDPQDQIPIAGWPLDVIFDKALQKLDQFANPLCFLILDEIDILVKNASKSLDGILYNLYRINERLTKARVSIIGISNVLNIKHGLDPRILSSLSEEEIVFPAYNALELTEILSDRAKLAFRTSALDEGVLSLCAALAAKEHGDARKALDLLRRSGEIAERKNAQHVVEEYIYLAQDDIETDQIREFIENLPMQLKTVLLSIYLIQKQKRVEEIITGDIYNCYAEIYEMVPGLNQLTQRRVSELLRELDLAGIINARVVSKGRYGRSKMIQLNISSEELRKSLESDRKIAELLDYCPVCSKTARLNRWVYENALDE